MHNASRHGNLDRRVDNSLTLIGGAAAGHRDRDGSGQDRVLLWNVHHNATDPYKKMRQIAKTPSRAGGTNEQRRLRRELFASE